jgi:DNA-directed RNA polymerase specialized sigma24 family protein
MYEVIARPGDALLVESLKYEACVRAYICRVLGLSESAKSELLDELLQELQGRVVQMTTPAARRGSGLKKLLLSMARDLLAEVAVALKTSEAPGASDRGTAASMDSLAHIQVSEHQALCSVVAKVQDLPDLTRRAFTLRKVYGYTAAEISERMGLTQEAVEKHLAASVRAVASAEFEEQPSRPI